MPKLTVNGQMREFDAEPDTPLLWVLREQLDLTGSKYGCGIAQCGACTVHIDGVPTRSCVRPVSTVGPDAKVVTIEGLAPNGTHSLQRAWAALDVRRAAAVGDADGGGRAVEAAEAHRRRHRRGDEQHLPLRHLQPRACRDQSRRRPGVRQTMTFRTDRRSFSAARCSAGGWPSASGRRWPALRLGAEPAAPLQTRSPLGGDRADDTVVIRIARSEMGQGSLTGLAQLRGRGTRMRLVA